MLHQHSWERLSRSSQSVRSPPPAGCCYSSYRCWRSHQSYHTDHTPVPAHQKQCNKIRDAWHAKKIASNLSITLTNCFHWPCMRLRCEPRDESPCPSWWRRVFPAAGCKTVPSVQSPPACPAAQASSSWPARKKERRWQTQKQKTQNFLLKMRCGVCHPSDFTRTKFIQVLQVFMLASSVSELLPAK